MFQRIFQKIKEKDIKYYIGLLLVVASVDFLLVRSWICVMRIVSSLKDLGLSFVYYFMFLFDKEGSTKPSVNELPKLNLQDYLPFSIDEVLRKLDIFPEAFFSFDNFKAYLLFVIQNLNIAIILLTMLVPCLWLLFDIIFDGYTKEHIDKPKGKKIFKLYERCRKVYGAASERVKSFISYLKEHKAFIYILALLWLVNTNLMTFVFEFVSWYLYFVVSFDFSSIGIQLCKLACDIIIALWTLPFPVWCVVGYVIFNICRTAAAYKKLEHMEAKNCGYVKSHPPVVMAVGTVGAGKTQGITDQSLSLEVCHHHMALELMDKNMLRFPEFDFQAFEKSVREQILSRNVKNLATARRYVRELRYEYGRHPKAENLWGYDIRKYKKSYNNGLEMVGIWKCLENYAQEYFIYSMKVSLILSNIAIRSNIQFIDKGYFEEMKVNFFKSDPAKMAEESTYSHIMDWDLFRIGCQMCKENAVAGSFEFGVIVASEIGKERRNALELKKVKLSEGVATQHNDAFNDWLKVIRHEATVEGVCFIIFLCDEQRPESWGADARDLCLVLRILKVSDVKLAIRFCFLPQIIEWIFPKYFKWYHKVKKFGNENVYFVVILHTLLGKLFQMAEYKRNTFGYKTQIYGSEMGDEITSTTHQLKEHKYYLMLKKIYARRYSTDCFKDIFAVRALEAGTSLYELPAYTSDCATLDELQQQNSYMVNTFLSMYIPATIQYAAYCAKNKTK